MREIKFRAWDGKAMHYTLDMGGFSELNEVFTKAVELGATIMQYTGLKDKNGVEIYEGDIVGYREDEIGMVKSHYIKYKVVYGFGAFTFEPLDLGNEHEPATLPCKVIGNIYENPELVEKAA